MDCYIQKQHERNAETIIAFCMHLPAHAVSRRHHPSLVNQCATTEMSSSSCDRYQPREFPWICWFATHNACFSAPLASTWNIRHCNNICMLEIPFIQIIFIVSHFTSIMKIWKTFYLWKVFIWEIVLLLPAFPNLFF